MRQLTRDAGMINGFAVGKLSSTEFLGFHITEDFSWMNNASLATYNNAFACSANKTPIAHHVTSCIAVWFGNSIAPNCKTLQCLVNEARKITGASLSFLLEIYNNRLNRQSLQLRGQLHPPLTQLLQSPVLGEKSGAPLWLLHQTAQQLHPPACQEAELSPLFTSSPLCS